MKADRGWRLRRATVAFGLLLPLAARAGDASFVIPTGTVVMVLPDAFVSNPYQMRTYERVMNVGTSGVAWCSRTTSTPTPNGAGSFPLAPYGDGLGRPLAEEFDRPDYVPQLPLYCTADTAATLTGEAY